MLSSLITNRSILSTLVLYKFIFGRCCQLLTKSRHVPNTRLVCLATSKMSCFGLHALSSSVLCMHYALVFVNMWPAQLHSLLLMSSHFAKYLIKNYITTYLVVYMYKTYANICFDLMYRLCLGKYDKIIRFKVLASGCISCITIGKYIPMNIWLLHL